MDFQMIPILAPKTTVQRNSLMTFFQSWNFWIWLAKVCSSLSIHELFYKHRDMTLIEKFRADIDNGKEEFELIK